jgi:hypothetical protein
VRDHLLASHRRAVFEGIHSANLWGDAQSVSGGGSSLSATGVVRRELPDLVRQYGVRTLLDAPCGDFNWMREVADVVDRYVGVDIVPALIAKNASLYQSDKISFRCADVAADPLPRSDLVLCRDCFIHLPTRLIYRALDNFHATGARWLLMTNDAAVGGYRDIPIGSFRPINFRRAPFLFPPAERIIHESDAGRELCLWEFSRLPVRRP